MTRRANTSKKRPPPDPIMARQRAEAEKAHKARDQAQRARESRIRRADAGNLVEALGEMFETEQESDKEYLKAWATAMAGYKTLLREQGMLGLQPLPSSRAERATVVDRRPDGLTEQERDAFDKAVEIFKAADVDRERAVALLSEVSSLPDFAVRVARWLRHGIRAVIEDGYCGEHLPQTPPVSIPPHPTELLPFDQLDPAVFARFNGLAAELLGHDFYLPRADGFQGHPHLTREDFADLGVIICQRVPGTTPKDWWEAAPIQRIAYMELALTGKHAAATSVPGRPTPRPQRLGAPRKNETAVDHAIEMRKRSPCPSWKQVWDECKTLREDDGQNYDNFKAAVLARERAERSNKSLP
jgi:hypothetical protein